MALGLKSRGPEQGLSGVERLHDLHVWAMGTSEIAMTAHLVMPDVPADDTFLQDATRQLHDRFHIEHVTLQAVRVPFTRPCAALAGLPSRTGPDDAGRTPDRGVAHRHRHDHDHEVTP